MANKRPGKMRLVLFGLGIAVLAGGGYFVYSKYFRSASESLLTRADAAL
jgi:hypothetical protein